MAAESSNDRAEGADSALSVLAAAIAELKGASPATPVTVVAPSLAAGSVLRRRLTKAAGALFLVDFTTPLNLARRVADSLLPEDSWRPATGFELESLIRTELARILAQWPAEAEGPPPRMDANLVGALAQAIFELAAAPDDHWTGMRPLDARSRLAFRVGAGVQRQAAGRGVGLETEMFSAALRGLESAGAAERVAKMGSVILFSLVNIPPSAKAFFERLASMIPLRVLELEVGVPNLDQRARSGADLGGSVVIRPAGWPELTVVDCPDRPTEVEVALREILAAAERGVAFEEMAVLVSDEAEYVERLVTAFAGALVPVNAIPARPGVRDRAVLVLSSALGFARSGLRADLVELASLVELGESRLGLDSARVEELTRLADLTGNLFAWAAEVMEEGAEGDDSPLLGYLRRRSDRSELKRLAAYLGGLRESAANLEEALGGESWESVAFAARRLYGELKRDLPLLYSDGGHEDRSSPLVNSLRTLRVLDGLGEVPSEQAFFMALDLLAERPFSPRPDPAGVRIATIDSYLPASYELVVMLGMDAQGYPRRPARGLLSESARRMAGLLSLSDRAVFSEWVFHAQLRLASRALLCRPRSASRRAEALFPSPAIQLARNLCERDGILTRHRSIASRSSFLAESAGAAGTLADLGRALVLGRPDVPGATLGEGRRLHFLPTLRPRLPIEQVRAAGRVRLPGGEPRRISTTAVESWLGCPFRYFGERVLGVEELDEPESKHSLDPRERGTLLHKVLEAVVRRNGNASLDALPAARAAAVEIAEGELAILRRRMRAASGSRRFWLERDLARIKREVARFVEMDAQFVASGGGTIALERKFESMFTCTALDGGSAAVRLVGKIDRLDRRDGGLAVIDYKTGSSVGYTVGNRPEPHKVQLTLYAWLVGEIADSEFDSGAAAITGWYWFISERKGYSTLDVDSNHLTELEEVASTAIAAMEAGLFPPGAHDNDDQIGCSYCDPLAGKNPWRRKLLAKALMGGEVGDDHGAPIEREFWERFAALTEGTDDGHA